jgi:hypothetical protein
MLYDITLDGRWNDILGKTTDKLVKSLFGNDFYVDKIRIDWFDEITILVKDVNDRNYYFLGEFECRKSELGIEMGFLKLYKDDNGKLIFLGDRSFTESHK